MVVGITAQSMRMTINSKMSDEMRRRSVNFVPPRQDCACFAPVSPEPRTLNPEPSRLFSAHFLALTVLLCFTTPLLAATVTFDQQTDPPGFFTHSTTKESATIASTTNAPLELSGYRFMYWAINGVRSNDFTGRALNPVAFPIYENTIATAYYLPATNDLDADGIPDWFEIHFYSSTNVISTLDSDGDGLTLDAEYRRDYHPNIKDLVSDGGVSRRRSDALVLIIGADLYRYTEGSTPAGFITAFQSVVSNGNVVVSTNLHGDLNGYTFAYWDVNGVRMADSLGGSLSRVSSSVSTTTVVTAHYIPTGDDIDADSLPDWWEWYYFGGTNNAAAGDADGDGLSNDVEYRRDYHPGLKDIIVDGGISRRRSDLVVVNLAGFFNYNIYSEPVGLIPAISSVAMTGTVVVTTNISPVAEKTGYMFTHWTVNGVRQSDAMGRALSQTQFAITTNIDAVAHFCVSTNDTDGDGLPDWWEIQNCGNTALGPMADPDGDGLTLDQEYRRDYHPWIKDIIVDGGISRRRSESVYINLQFFERVEYALMNSILTNFYTVWPTGVTGYAFGPNSVAGAGDWDGNGTPDIFVGSTGGVLTVFQNMGTRYTLNLTNRTEAFTGIAGGWSGIANPAPALGDWNGDGRADLVIGGDGGRIRLVMSTGNFISPQSPAVNYDLMVTGSVQCIPAFADVNGDGRPDMLALVDGGLVRAYTNTGVASAPYEQDNFSMLALDMPVPNATGLGAGDVDYDGKLDVLVSDAEGRIWDFRGNGAGVFTLKSKVWAGSGKGLAQRLAIGPADMDGDGDIDALCGFAGGGLIHLRDPRLGVPVNLRAFSGPSSVRLEWAPNREYRIKGYYVYRSAGADGPFERLTGNWITDSEYLDSTAAIGQTNFYQVASVTLSLLPGNSTPIIRESRPSEVVSGVAGSVILSMPDYYGVAGTSTVVAVNLGNARGIVGNGMEIRVTYNPAIVRPITQADGSKQTVEKTMLTSSFGVTDNALTANGELVLQATGATEINGDGRVCDLVWQVDPAALAGSRVTNVVSYAYMRDSLGRSVTVSVPTNAILTVQAPGSRAYFRGDISGDGILDQADFTLAMKLAVGQRPATADELSAGDLNGNGKIDKDDAHLILRLVHGQNVNP
ncbi:MAG: hypothetical protein C0404_09715 [Verrucomicrobia bacterium]|nr:hypothetical protein [Verrucomicrobiota bacterium]